MEEMGLSEQEALDLATRRIDAEKQVNAEKEKGRGRYDEDGRRADGRRQIKGYSFEKQGGADEARARAGKRVDDARTRIQADYDRAFPGISGAPEFGPGRLRDEFQFPGLDAGFGEVPTRAASNAAASETRSSAANDSAGLLKEIAGILQQGLLE